MNKKNNIVLTSDYLTGIPGIDKQHEKLVVLMDTFLARPEKESGAAFAAVSFKNIGESLRNHFSTEEMLMDMVGLSGTERHKSEHLRFLAGFADEAEKCLGSGAAGEMNGFIRQCRENALSHIASFDRDLANHIEQLMELRKKFNITALSARILTE